MGLFNLPGVVFSYNCFRLNHMNNKQPVKRQFLAPTPQKLETWMNPTKDVVIADVFVRPPADANEVGRTRWEFKPGQTRDDIPADHAVAFHAYNHDKSQIVGGLAPQLVKVGTPAIPMHPSLDVEFQKSQSALNDAAKALAEKKAQEDALLIATARAEEARKAQAAATAARQAASAAPKPEAKPSDGK